MKPAQSLSDCVEQICGLGCDRVRDAIASLEQNQLLQLAEHLNPVDRQQLLEELRSIMAVYDQRQRT
jgi:hypothetical protein